LHCNNSEGPVRFRPIATDPDHEIDLIEEGLGLSWVEPFLAMIDGRPFAYIQAYDVHAEPGAEYADQPQGCWGVAPFIGEAAARFDHVLVDEYQDTNRLQASILLKLKPDGHGLTVVGDDAQSIYSFRVNPVRT
jgi:hypothetical protein